MQKIINSRVLKTEDRFKQSYYMHQSAKRYALRYSTFKSRLLAERVFARRLRTQFREITGGLCRGPYLWWEKVAEHKRKFNATYRQREEESNRRMRETERMRQEEINQKARELVASQSHAVSFRVAVQ